MALVTPFAASAARALIASGFAWLLCAACSGCTLNGRPLLGPDPRQYFENAAHTGRSVMIDAWGINLSTVDGDAGLTVGRTRRTYYFAGPQADANGVRPADHLSGGAANLRLATTRPFDVGATSPLAVRGRSDGVSIGAGMVGVHLTAGLQSFEALRLPSRANLFLLLRTRTAHPDDDVFHVTEIRP